MLFCERYRHDSSAWLGQGLPNEQITMISKRVMTRRCSQYWEMVYMKTPHEMRMRHHFGYFDLCGMLEQLKLENILYIEKTRIITIDDTCFLGFSIRYLVLC